MANEERLPGRKRRADFWDCVVDVTCNSIPARELMNDRVRDVTMYDCEEGGFVTRPSNLMTRAISQIGSVRRESGLKPLGDNYKEGLDGKIIHPNPLRRERE